MAKTEVAVDPIDVHREVAALRLSLDVIHRALENGYVRRTFCTPNSPIATPGTESWRGTIEELRNQLIVIAGEWRRADVEGLPVVVNDAHKIVVAVMTGDDATGSLHRKVKPKNRKGTVVKMCTVENGGQADMFGYVPERQAPRDFQGYDFWILLQRTADGVVYSELSRPTVYSDKSKKIVDWSKRIIIPPVLPHERATVTPDAPTDDLDFELKKIA